MKRVVLLSLLALAVLIARPTALFAQVLSAPTPTPDPHTYSDPAMTFHAPQAFVLAANRPLELASLGGDPQPVAGWVYPDKDHPRALIIEQQVFDGNVGDFDGIYEQGLRSKFDGALFKDKTNIALSNGMPAIFMTMSSGEGFDIQKLYIVIWADGSRGVALVLKTQLDDIDVPTARRMLSDVSATRYPAGRQ
jgi:hypothetical protein